MSKGKVLLLRGLVGLTLLATSFCITLLVIDAYDIDGQAERQRTKEKAVLTQTQGIPIGGGVRVYSPGAEQSGIHTADRAFVGARSADRFWESPGGFPVDLFVLLPAARTLEQYALASGEVSERMPSAWVLEGSGDATDWFLLDQQRAVERWGAGETRTYRVATPRAATMLRFRFTAGQHERLLRIYAIDLKWRG